MSLLKPWGSLAFLWEFNGLEFRILAGLGISLDIE